MPHSLSRSLALGPLKALLSIPASLPVQKVALTLGVWLTDDSACRKTRSRRRLGFGGIEREGFIGPLPNQCHEQKRDSTTAKSRIQNENIRLASIMLWPDLLPIKLPHQHLPRPLR